MQIIDPTEMGTLARLDSSPFSHPYLHSLPLLLLDNFSNTNETVSCLPCRQKPWALRPCPVIALFGQKPGGQPVTV